MKNEILNRPLLWVTGKGGVGKSTVAASLAHRASREGKKVLLVELGDQSHFSRLTGIDAKRHEAQSTRYGFDYVLWSGESCLKEYVLHFVKLDAIVKLFFENRIMRSFLDVAPAVKELAITGKATSRVRNIGPELPYDQIIIDSFATGHMLALLRAPAGMANAVNEGPMGRESQRIFDVLNNPKETGYVIVSLPEELPVQEGLELGEAIEKIFANQKVQYILNRLWKVQFDENTVNKLSDSKIINSDIASFLSLQLTRQKKMLSRLSSENISTPIELPFLMNHDFETVISELGAAL